MENSVARGIKKIIEEKGLMKKFVAQKAKFTEQQLSDMINGRKIIRAEYLPPIARALEVSINDIYAAGMSTAEAASAPADADARAS